MSKRYIHYRSDLADLAALQTVADSNPTSFPVGCIYVTADGAMHNVISNDGSTVVIGTITST